MRLEGRTALRRLALSIGAALALGAPLLANAASFDCKKASTKVERLICEDRALSEMDDDLGDIYPVEDDVPANDPVRIAQRSWLARRNACTTADCLTQQYELRLSQLFCDERIASRSLGSGIGAGKCQYMRVAVLKRELAPLVQRHAAMDIENTTSPDYTREVGLKVHRTWYEHMQARCELHGAQEGGTSAWQSAWAGGCMVDEIKQRIAWLHKELGDTAPAGKARR
ncbi:hypothetical protein [Mitsuaria sp. GD03876]|uniref:lysozyme inhibitor LprI family protein n=1 Tax=Mitsuaria sp. GD03876 TaxID=2975399 RepID=UPI0024487C4A|nr:hypothetical protein [Mitsuaria sp. GD03876]MDH0864427.1 hypothetical protein [Mitsuaria sp. GD03876]